MHDIGVSQVFLVEGKDAAFGGEVGLEVLVGGGQGNAGVTDFYNQVRHLEALPYGACGRRHVAGEPVNGSASGVERHLPQALLYTSHLQIFASVAETRSKERLTLGSFESCSGQNRR